MFFAALLEVDLKLKLTKIVNYSLYCPLTSISVKNSSTGHSIDKEKLPQAALIIIYKMKEKQFKKWDPKWCNLKFLLLFA